MKKILVPTDFSDNANQALKYAVVLAQASGAEIVLLHVYNETLPVHETPLLRYTKGKVGLKNCMQQMVPAEIKQSCICESGNAVEKIAEIAIAQQADLVVMGIRGSNRLSQLIIGSTTTALIRTTKLPVFVIPENANADSPEKLLFAFDGKDIPSKLTMKPLREIAGIFNAEILTLNVMHALEVPLLDKRFIAREAFHALEGTDYSMHFSQNSDVLEGINDFIAQHEVNAVAMIYRPVGFFNRIFTESRAHKMAFYTKKPLLILPELKE